MGTINWDNLADHAMRLLETVDLTKLDPETIEGLEDAAAGLLPPQVAAMRARDASSPLRPATPTPNATTSLPLASSGGSATPGSRGASSPLASATPTPNPTTSLPLARSGGSATPTPNATTSLPLSRSGGRGGGGVRVTSATPNAQPLTHNHHLTPEETVEHDPAGPQQVTHSEPAPTTSAPLKKSKKCAAQNKRTGNQCRAWATHTGYCVFHDPDLTEAVNEMRAKGGRAPRRVLIGEARKLNFDSMDRASIQALISHVIRLQLLGAMTPRQASTTVKLIGHLVSNAREMAHSDDSHEAFEQTNRELTDLTDTVAERLEGRDLTDRLNTIQDAGSRREQVLKINDRWAPRPIYRSARDYPH